MLLTCDVEAHNDRAAKHAKKVLLTFRMDQKSKKDREQVHAAMHTKPSSCMPSWRPEPP